MSINKVVIRIVSISFTVLVCILVVMGLYRFGQDAYNYGYRVYTEPAMDPGSNKDILVTITDTDTMAIATVLEEKGLIPDKYLFFLQMNLGLSGKQKESIEEGVYTLSPSMTGRELYNALLPVEEPEDE